MLENTLEEEGRHYEWLASRLSEYKFSIENSETNGEKDLLRILALVTEFNVVEREGIVLRVE